MKLIYIVYHQIEQMDDFETFTNEKKAQKYADKINKEIKNKDGTYWDGVIPANVEQTTLNRYK